MKMKNRSRDVSLSFEGISLQPYTYTYDGLERLENGAPLGPGCGGRAEESHLLCIELHRDLAYKRPGRLQSLVFVDRDPAFYFNANPDPAPLQSDGNLRPLVYRPPGLHIEPPLPQASIVSVQGPTWLCFETLNMLNFDFNADSDPDPDPASKDNANPIQIRINNTGSHQDDVSAFWS
jgi:hypothetical protein